MCKHVIVKMIILHEYIYSIISQTLCSTHSKGNAYSIKSKQTQTLDKTTTVSIMMPLSCLKKSDVSLKWLVGTKQKAKRDVVDYWFHLARFRALKRYSKALKNIVQS